MVVPSKSVCACRPGRYRDCNRTSAAASRHWRSPGAHASRPDVARLERTKMPATPYNLHVLRSPSPTAPIHIELDREQRSLLVRWQDEHESRFGWEFLRGHCPCANCSEEAGKSAQLSSLP